MLTRRRSEVKANGIVRQQGIVMELDPGRLQHWSRVAFATRCARRVQPLFDQAWPNAAQSRKSAIERAIALAEQAAAASHALDGLSEAAIAAVAVAGRALIPHVCAVPKHDSEADPHDPQAAEVASFSAKVAEKAAETAAATPAESAGPAREAFGFAADAIRAAGQWGLMERLEADFAVLAGMSDNKPWWRFW